MEEVQEHGSFSDRDYSVREVPVDRVQEYWPLIEEWLEDLVSVSQELYTLRDLFEAIMSERVKLWIVRRKGEIQGLFFSEIRHFPQKKVCLITGCAGDNMLTWYPGIDEIERWARANGCHRMQCISRKGFARLLKPLGYTWEHSILEKDIEKEH